VRSEASWPVVFVARHAESRGNVDAALTSVAASGPRGSGLTPEGERQAMALALTLLGASVEAVFSSDALCAERTATIIAERLRLPLFSTRALRERAAEESHEEAAKRLLDYARARPAAGAGRTLLLVIHGGIMRALLVHLGYAGSDELPQGAIANGGYLSLRLSPDSDETVLEHAVGVRRIV
jgi:broad specificity phosphatase PhoE